MKKAHKVLIAVGSSFFAILLAGFSATYFTFLHRYKGSNVVNEWHESDVFNIDDIPVINKPKDRDLVILNLADVQIADLDGPHHFDVVHKEINYLVKTYKPDLITLTGDQTMSNENMVFLKSLISWLDSYKIPYAPVFGNHDYGNSYNSAVASVNYCCDLYERGEYSLFNRGPTNIGSLGNYAINIKEDDKIISTLYMMDLGYNETITEGQRNWFKWTADGIKEVNGGEYTRGMCFMHKDFKEFYYAYHNYLDHPETAEGDVYRYDGFSFVDSEGFVEIAKTCGVYDFVCGHHHNNNFTIKYEDARYTFAVKSSEAVYYYQDENIYLNGATEIRINKDQTSFHHHFVGPNQFHFTTKPILD